VLHTRVGQASQSAARIGQLLSYLKLTTEPQLAATRRVAAEHMSKGEEKMLASRPFRHRAWLASCEHGR
jgi:hypothetical protein